MGQEINSLYLEGKKIILTVIKINKQINNSRISIRSNPIIFYNNNSKKLS